MKAINTLANLFEHFLQIDRVRQTEDVGTNAQKEMLYPCCICSQALYRLRHTHTHTHPHTQLTHTTHTHTHHKRSHTITQKYDSIVSLYRYSHIYGLADTNTSHCLQSMHTCIILPFQFKAHYNESSAVATATSKSSDQLL